MYFDSSANIKTVHGLMVYHQLVCIQVIMELRGFDGELCFDNKEQTLDLRIIPRDKDVAVTSSKTSSLSGGERSYSTVALLIALWYCVDSPFYFLDEYDVFTVSNWQNTVSEIDCLLEINILSINSVKGSSEPNVHDQVIAISSESKRS